MPGQAHNLLVTPERKRKYLLDPMATPSDTHASIQEEFSEQMSMMSTPTKTRKGIFKNPTTLKCTRFITI